MAIGCNREASADSFLTKAWPTGFCAQCVAELAGKERFGYMPLVALCPGPKKSDENNDGDNVLSAKAIQSAGGNTHAEPL